MVNFVILGAGDLVKKKLIPSIFNLIKKKKLKKFKILITSLDKKFKVDKSKKYIKDFDDKTWSILKENLHYYASNFYNKECDLGLFVREFEIKGPRIFYLATLPQHFKIISDHLKKCSLVDKDSKVVFEKPFGHDLKSAKSINKCIKKLFKEKQIYRIDHYLGKELIQNIHIARFENVFLEPILNNKYVEEIQLILSEDVGIEERGPFYDKYGAIRDVMQNHMMQMMALTMMDKSNDLRSGKVKLLKKVRTSKILVKGQYVGYSKDVGHSSQTETFAATKLFVDNKRWEGVPIYLITGKKMKKKVTRIYIKFKNKNSFTIQIQPDAGFVMHMNSKVPGNEKLTEIKMDFCHKCLFGINTPEAYENLLHDVIKGDQSSFVRTDEIEEQWKIVDKINKIKVPLLKYKKGTYPKKGNITKWHM